MGCWDLGAIVEGLAFDENKTKDVETFEYTFEERENL